MYLPVDMDIITTDCCPQTWPGLASLVQCLARLVSRLRPWTSDRPSHPGGGPAAGTGRTLGCPLRASIAQRGQCSPVSALAVAVCLTYKTTISSETVLP